MTSSSITSSSDLQKEFDQFFLLSDLLSQLFIVFGWVERNTDHNLRGTSIFSIGPMKRRGGALPHDSVSLYKTRSNFDSDDLYTDYVKRHIVPGMRVRARVSDNRVSKGDMGKCQSLLSNRPYCEVVWDNHRESILCLHNLEIMDNVSPSDESELLKMYVHCKYMYTCLSFVIWNDVHVIRLNCWPC